MSKASDQKRIALVTGASGTIGPTLVRHLLAEGWDVRVLMRTRPEGGLLPGRAEFFRGDITARSTLTHAVSGVDVIFHLAAKLHINNPPPELAEEYEKINVHGTENLVHVAVEASVPRFVYFSTINFYVTGQGGDIFNEASQPCPRTMYAQTKYDAEQAVMANHPNATVLRLATVYGARLRGNYPKLIRALKSGLAIMVGDGQNRRTLVHVSDVARAAIAAAKSEKARDRVYNVTDGNVYTFDEIARAIQRALDKREGIIYIPPGPVRVILSQVKWASQWVGWHFPVSPALINKLTEDMAVAGNRLQEELEFTPIYGLESGWREVVSSSYH